MSIGIPELLIVFLIAMLLFGPGLVLVAALLLGPRRLARIAGELGKIVRAFRDGLLGKDNEQGQS